MASASSAKGAQLALLCSTCEKNPVKKGQKRCNDCSSVAMRVSRGLKTSDALQEAWQNTDIPKAEIYLQCANLFGADLVKQLESSLDVSVTKETEKSMTGKGDLMTEAQVKTEFASEPARLAAILKNAERHWDKQGEVELLEVLRYTSLNVGKEKQTVTLKRSCEATQVIKPAKVAKPKAAPKVKEEEGPKPISDVQITQLNKHKSDIEKLLESNTKTLDGLLNEPAPEWASHVPRYVAADARLARANVLKAKGDIELVLSEKSAQWKTLVESINAVKAEVRESTRKAKLQVPEAKAQSANEQ